MALDTKAIVSVGYWPILYAELDPRIATYGYVGVLGPPVTVSGLIYRQPKRHHVAFVGQLRM